MLLKLLIISFCVFLTHGITLPSNYCETAENKTHIYEVNVNFIELGAFDACPNLEFIQIEGSLGTFDFQLFRKNTMLTEISLSYVGLHKIKGDPSIQLNKLTSIDLTFNFLTDFPFNEFAVLPNLKNFLVSRNYLTDIDTDKLVSHFPSVKWIEFDYNSIECDIFEKINEQLKQKNIFRPYDREDGPYYQTSKTNFHNIVCLMSPTINEIFQGSNLSIIRGRIDNEPIRQDVKLLRQMNEQVVEDVQMLAMNISDIEAKYSNLIMTVHEMENYSGHKEGKSSKNILIYFIMGFTFFLAVVIGFVVKCFLGMRRDLVMLRQSAANMARAKRT